ASHPDHTAASEALVRAITRNPADAPEFIGILSRLEGVNEGLFWRLLATSDPAERVALMRGIADEIRRGGNLSEDQIAHTLREVGSLVGRIETRFGLEIE